MTCGWLPEAANPAPMKCAVHGKKRDEEREEEHGGMESDTEWDGGDGGDERVSE